MTSLSFPSWPPESAFIFRFTLFKSFPHVLLWAFKHVNRDSGWLCKKQKQMFCWIHGNCGWLAMELSQWHLFKKHKPLNTDEKRNCNAINTEITREQQFSFSVSSLDAWSYHKYTLCRLGLGDHAHLWNTVGHACWCVAHRGDLEQCFCLWLHVFHLRNRENYWRELELVSGS